MDEHDYSDSDASAPSGGQNGADTLRGEKYWPACWPAPNSATQPGDVDVTMCERGRGGPCFELRVVAAVPASDVELDAIRVILETLRPLDDEAVDRVVGYVAKRVNANRMKEV